MLASFFFFVIAATAGPFPETDAPSAPFSINLIMISGSEFRIDAVVNPLMIIASQ